MIDTVYVDLDQVCVNFLKGAERALGMPFPECKLSKKEKWAKIDENRYFWLELEPMADLYDLWGAIKHLNPIILSSPARYSPRCEQQKREWVQMYLSADTEVIITPRENKQLYTNSKSLLIDDYVRNCEQFVAMGGQAIVHTDAATTIKQLSTLRII